MVYIAITLLLGFAAVNTGNNLIYLLVSALLGFMVVSGVLGHGNLRALRLELLFPEELYAGIPTLLTLRLTNERRRWPAFLIRANILGQAPLFVVVPRGETVTTAIEVTLDGRGPRTLQGIRLSSIFPVNFFRRSYPLPDPPAVTVFPAPLPCPRPGGEGGSRRSGERTVSGRGADGELARISDYTGSESLKRIHWKLSARHDQLKVKEHDATGAIPLLVDLDALPGASLEARLGCASYLISSCIRHNRPVGLKLGARVLAPSSGRFHKLQLLNALACHGRD